MKVELHLHTSRYSACAVASAEDLMRRLVECGYDATFITEHDTTWGDWELAELRAAFPAIRILPGVELALGKDLSQHLLVLGTNDRSYQRIPTAAGILERAREEGHLTILAHPFRWQEMPELLEAKTLPDAMEYLTGNHSVPCAQKSRLAAEANRMALVNAGDVHAVTSVDRFWIETLRPFETAAELRELVRTGMYVNRSADGIAP